MKKICYKRRTRRRQLRDGVSYHVVDKINRDEFIFDNDLIINLYYETIEKCKKKYSFDIQDFDIMGNHVHFILFPRKNASLPKIMQWLKSVFAKAYNKLTGQSGHVWKDRYYSVIIETVEQFVNTFEYILMNPVAANMVKHARDYPYSSLYHYLHNIEGILDYKDPFIRSLYERCRDL